MLILVGVVVLVQLAVTQEFGSPAPTPDCKSCNILFVDTKNSLLINKLMQHPQENDATAKMKYSAV